MSPPANNSTRDRILDQARAALAEGDVGAVGLRELARRSGVSSAAPLRHFPTIGALRSALAAEGFAALEAAIRDAAQGVGPGASPERCLRAGGMAYIEFARENPARYELMFRRDLLDTSDAELISAGPRAFEALIALVEPLAHRWPDLTVHQVAESLWAATHGFVQLWMHNAFAATDPSATFEQRAVALFDLHLQPREESS